MMYCFYYVLATWMMIPPHMIGIAVRHTLMMILTLICGFHVKEVFTHINAAFSFISNMATIEILK